MDATCYTGATLESFLTHILRHHESHVLLIICSERRAFIHSLLKSIEKDQRPSQLGAIDPAVPNDEPDIDHDGRQQPREPAPRPPHPLLTRTLKVLAASQSIQVAFCPSVQVLRAYLATPHLKTTNDGNCEAEERTQLSTLALIKPVSVHRATASYSAQGVSETLAAAVEASSREGTKLSVVETVDSIERPASEEFAEARADERIADGAAALQTENRDSHDQPAAMDPLEEQLPILNATTKMFGVSGQRTMMGRTVKVGDVVKRWCRMQPLPDRA